MERDRKIKFEEERFSTWGKEDENWEEEEIYTDDEVDQEDTSDQKWPGPEADWEEEIWQCGQSRDRRRSSDPRDRSFGGREGAEHHSEALSFPSLDRPQLAE